MWINAFFLTFLFFLIQLGIGLAILAIAPPRLIEASRLTKVQFIVLGYVVGASAAAILPGLYSVVIDGIWLHLAIMIALSTFGLAWTSPFWRPRTGDGRPMMQWCLLSLPIALMTWWLTFGAFSSFPYADLGADVHWMKTAQEYADSGLINPYASQSYIDLRPALAGALSGTLGLDLLQFSWTYRYFSILFVLMAFYAFAEGVYSDPLRKWIAFFFAAAGNSVALLTNGSMAVAGSVAFLGILLGSAGRNVRENIRTGSVALLVISVAITLLVVFLLNNNTLVLAFVAGALLLLRVWGKAGTRETVIFAGCIWPATLLLAHRGSYLFVTAVVAAWLCYLLIAHAMSRYPKRSTSVLRALSIMLPLIIGGMAGWIVAIRLGYISFSNANAVFSHITGLVIGREIKTGDELALGAGPQVAVIELGRAIGPLFALCIAMAIAWWWTDQSNRSANAASDPAHTARVSKLLWSWTIGCGLALAVLSGFPFLYRTIMIILALLTITATETFCQLLIDPASASLRRRASTAVTVTLLAAGLVVAVYAFAWRPDLPYARYQDFLRPTVIAAVVLLVVLVPLTFNTSRRIYTCALATIVGLGIAVDRAGLAGISRTYSYGVMPSGVTTIAHYNASDLETAAWLRRNMKKGILLSDPYTLGIIQSLTGAPAAYLFSNLDTVNETISNRARAVISAIVEPKRKTRRRAEVCAYARPLLQNINSETSFQMGKVDAISGILRAVRTKAAPPAEQPASVPQTPIEDLPVTDDAIEDPLATDSDSWQLVAIINPRTIEWTRLDAGQRLGYFPPAEPIDPAFIQSLQAGPFRAMFTNAQTAVVRIPCPV